MAVVPIPSNQGVVAKGANQVIVASQAQSLIIAVGATKQVAGCRTGEEIANHACGLGDQVLAVSRPIGEGHLYPNDLANLSLGRSKTLAVCSHHGPGGAVVC